MRRQRGFIQAAGRPHSAVDVFSHQSRQQDSTGLVDYATYFRAEQKSPRDEARYTFFFPLARARASLPSLFCGIALLGLPRLGLDFGRPLGSNGRISPMPARANSTKGHESGRGRCLLQLPLLVADKKH